MILDLIRNLRADVELNEGRPSAEEICQRLDVIISLMEKEPQMAQVQPTWGGTTPVVGPMTSPPFPLGYGTQMQPTHPRMTLATPTTMEPPVNTPPPQTTMGDGDSYQTIPAPETVTSNDADPEPVAD